MTRSNPLPGRLVNDVRRRLAGTFLGGLEIGLALAGLSAVPGPAARAQDLTRTQLVGTWMRAAPVAQVDRRDPPVMRETILTFNADGTWAVTVKDNGVALPLDAQPYLLAQLQRMMPERRWYLSGDSLWFGDPRRYSPDDPVSRPRKVVLRGGRMVLADYALVVADSNVERFSCSAQLSTQSYTRVDPAEPRPAPLPPPVPPPTVARENLVGTWVVTRPAGVDGAGETDTVVLGADSTWRAVSAWLGASENYKTVYGGTWYLLPGDMLWLASGGELHLTAAIGRLTSWSQDQLTLEQRVVWPSDSRCGAPAQSWSYRRGAP